MNSNSFFSNKPYIFILLIGALFWSYCSAMTEEMPYFYANFCKKIPETELITKYQQSAEHKDKTRSNFAESYAQNKKPNHLIKGTNAVSRVRGSMLIRECAAAYNLDVSAPEKLFTDSRGDCIVVPRISAIEAPFTLHQMKHLYKMIKKTGYGDIKKEQILNTAEGIIMLVDTEICSFYVPESLDIPQYDLFKFLNRMKTLSMDIEAKQWLLKKIAKKENEQNNSFR